MKYFHGENHVAALKPHWKLHKITKLLKMCQTIILKMVTESCWKSENLKWNKENGPKFVYKNYLNLKWTLAKNWQGATSFKKWSHNNMWTVTGEFVSKSSRFKISLWRSEWTSKKMMQTDKAQNTQKVLLTNYKHSYLTWHSNWAWTSCLAILSLTWNYKASNHLLQTHTAENGFVNWRPNFDFEASFSKTYCTRSSNSFQNGWPALN